MQVQPNSTIYLLAGVPVDKGYNYSLHFEDRATQTATMQRFIMQNGTFTAQQYTRPEKNVLRVNICADEVLNCNYVMFKNDGIKNGTHRYANKWFYAFAHVEYVNEFACNVVYEIDKIQTWMFDYEFEECFVEREHAIADVAGDNLQPEPVDTGELVAYRKIETGFSDYMLCSIITNIKLEDTDNEITLNYGGSIAPALNETYNIQPTFRPDLYVSGGSYYDNSSGIPCGLYVYTGLLAGEEDWANHFEAVFSLYNMINPVGTYAGSLPNNPILSAGKLLDAITRGLIVGKTTSENNIVTCYIYPADFNRISYETTAANYGFKKGIGVKDEYVLVPNPFNNGSNDVYTPINNKLKTSPFAKIYVTSETGSTGEYRFEFFEKNQNDVTELTWANMSSYFGQASATFVPKNYKGKQFDYDSSLVSSPYPVPIYSGNAFQSWWQQSKSSFILGGISNALSCGLASMLRFNASHAESGISSAVQGTGALAGNIGTLIDKTNVPPNSYYQAQNEALTVGTKRTKFIVYFLCITPEYARKIDSFFTKYGYATNELKIPNLQRRHAKRQWWNYLKVKNCMLHGIIPADVEQELEQIYERGITMWTYDVRHADEGGYVGNYSRDNPVVTPT